MSKWKGTDELVNMNPIAGVVTASPISFPVALAINPDSARADVVVSAITAAGTQTLLLQEYRAGAWVTIKSATYSATGTIVMRINLSDTGLIPMSQQIRLAVTQDAAGASTTFSSATIYRHI